MPGSRYGFLKTAWLIRPTLHLVGRWSAQTSRVRVSARSRPSPPLYPHFGLLALCQVPVWWEAVTNIFSWYNKRFYTLNIVGSFFLVDRCKLSMFSFRGPYPPGITCPHCLKGIDLGLLYDSWGLPGMFPASWLRITFYHCEEGWIN